MKRKSKLKIKKRNIYLLIILSILTIVIFYTLGRYTINNKNIHIQSSEEFYFNSNILNENSPTYNLKDWDGESQYALNIDLKSYEDFIRKTSLDINYEIEANTNNENISVNLSKNTGTLTSKITDDIVQVIINNNGTNIKDGEYITVFVKAISTSPYTKEISANFNIFKKSNEEYFVDLNDKTGEEWTTVTIKTNNLSSQKSLVYDTTKAILDTTNPLFTNYTTITPGNIKLDLESNKIYKIEFIKKDSSAVLELGKDIDIQ